MISERLLFLLAECVLPGLSTAGIAVLDIPAGAALDEVVFQENSLFGGQIAIRVS